MTSPFALSSELISELLSGLRLNGVRYQRIQTGNTFGFTFARRPGHAYLHYVAVGEVVLQTANGECFSLSAGEALFIPHGGEHQLMSATAADMLDIDDFETVPLDENVSGIDTCPGTQETPGAVLFFGCMNIDLGSMQRLAGVMPEVMRADAKGANWPGLMPILDAMKREICSGRVGYAGILARLADVVAAMFIRGWVEGGCGTSQGLAAALRDPRLARAILAIHREPGRDWSVAELAAESHISRSAFAERFQTTIGIPPLRYATEVRMHLAVRWLSSEKITVDLVSQRLGYSSQAAFSRAFKRVTGESPGAMRVAGSPQDSRR